MAAPGPRGRAPLKPDLIRDAITHELPGRSPARPAVAPENEDGTGDIDAEAAWGITTGDPAVIVGIVDTGFDMDHPDLQANIVGGFDALSNDDDPEAGCSASPDGAGPCRELPARTGRPRELRHCRGWRGGCAGNNALLGAGVCPDCTLFPVRFIGSGGFRSLSKPPPSAGPPTQASRSSTTRRPPA
ncbi:MAG: S8 family serine peptidase [bacterium]